MDVPQLTSFLKSTCEAFQKLLSSREGESFATAEDVSPRPQKRFISASWAKDPGRGTEAAACAPRPKVKRKASKNREQPAAEGGDRSQSKCGACAAQHKCFEGWLELLWGNPVLSEGHCCRGRLKPQESTVMSVRLVSLSVVGREMEQSFLE